MRLPSIVGKKRRLGRGIASRGAKSGRGMKGQRSRAGSHQRAGFEGGQTPLYQRLPKERGAKQIYSSQVTKPVIMRVSQLNRFSGGDIVGPGVLRKSGLIKRNQRIKIIGGGTLDKKLTMRVHAATDNAREVVEGAGGKIEIID